MKAHIETNTLGQTVKVYLYDESPTGRSFYWPVEYGEYGWSWFTYHEGDHTQGRVPEVRPAYEMSLQMWGAFTKSLMESEHIRVDALDIIAKTLEREQDRVDKLIDATIRRAP